METRIAALTAHPYLTVTSASLLSTVISTAFLLVASQLIPAFDTSPLLLSKENWHSPLLAWDATYFFSIAQHGYRHEQELAFAPGLPFLLRWSGGLVAWCAGANTARVQDLVVGGIIISAFARAGASLSLYKLTESLFPTRKASFPLLVTLLHLLATPSVAVWSSVAYTEPFFALTSFLGMWAVLHRRYASAALAFGAGTLFRPQGTVLGLGFFGWFLFLDPARPIGLKRIVTNLPRFCVYSLISVAPFVGFQTWIARQLCSTALGEEARPWCSSTLKSSYGFIQSHYWNNGFLRYWTVSNAPLFLLTLPVIIPSLLSVLSPPRTARRSTIVPFQILHTALLLLLLFAGHVQILLRVCGTNPYLWWWLAGNVCSRGSVGRWWIGYAVVWGWGISVMLWAGFLPPA